MGSTAAVEKRALIVFPIFTTVEPDPFANFFCMGLLAGQQANGWKFDVMPQKRKLLHQAMNEAASTVLEAGHAGMIVCDDDCLPPHDAIPRLMAHADQGRDYVAGVGVMKGWPHTTTVGRYFPEGISIVLHPKTGDASFSGFEWLDDVDALPQGLVDVDFCGVPIAWISRRVFERVDPPWFGTHLDGGEVTHDVYFARKVKAAGLAVQVDTTLRCAHTTLPGIVDFRSRAAMRAVVEQQRKGA